MAHVDRRPEPGNAAPAARRRRGPLRRRPGRARGRREPLPRRRRGRARRRRLRAAARGRRLQRRPSTPTRSCTSITARTSSPSSTACPPPRSKTCSRRAAHVVTETIFQQAYAPVPMEGRGLVVDWSHRDRRAHDLRRDPVAARGAPVLLPPARGPRAPRPGHHARHRRRVRPEGPGAARRDVPDARRAEGRRAGEVGRRPPREPARGRQVAPRARRRHDGVRRRRRDPGRPHRLRLRLRRVPDSVARRPGGRGRHAVPGPVPRAARRLRDQDDLHEHRGAHGVPGAVAVRVARARDAARHRGAPDGHGPDGAAPAQPAPPRRSAVRQPQRHDLRQHLADRRRSSRR